MTALAQRPANPVVGESVVHESADLHVTGAALYTDAVSYTHLHFGNHRARHHRPVHLEERRRLVPYQSNIASPCG